MVRVDVKTGAIQDFAANRGKTNGPASKIGGAGFERRSEPFSAEALPSTASISHGEQMFFEHWHPCHTGGEAALAPAINNKPLPGFMIRLQTRRGFGAMPAFPESKINDQDLDDLVAYLKALRAKD